MGTIKYAGGSVSVSLPDGFATSAKQDEQTSQQTSAAGYLASLAALVSGGALTVTQQGALPAGTNVIGHVVVDSASNVAVTALPALPTGSNVIGHVVVDSGSALSVTSLPALPTGSNVIGQVAATAVGGGALSTEATLLAVKALLPTALGQAARAASLSVALSTEDAAVQTALKIALENVAPGIPDTLGSGGGEKVEGVGTAGVPAGGVVSVQNVPLATYSAATSGTVDTATAATTETSIAYLFHPSSNTKTVKIRRVNVSWSGNAGNNPLTLRLCPITAENATPGGSTVLPHAHDASDAASGLSLRVGATGAPTRASSVIASLALVGGSTDQQRAVMYDDRVAGQSRSYLPRRRHEALKCAVSSGDQTSRARYA